MLSLASHSLKVNGVHAQRQVRLQETGAYSVYPAENYTKLASRDR